MFLKVSLLLAGGVFLAGQSPRTASSTDVFAAGDAALLDTSVSLDELTQEKAAQMEQAARRQVDRVQTRLNRVKTMVDAGLEPRQSLEAPTAELASARARLDLTL